MGIVYKAYDPLLDRHAAIKLMNAAAEPDSDLQHRFLREARSAARLNHPNIVSVYDIGEHESRHFIAMEYVEGTDLKDLLEKQVFLPFEKKIGLMISLSRALDYAHRQGVIHRDVKPGNIRLTPSGDPKILDFGIARLAGGEATRSGKALGSAYYMSPEQITGAEEVDGRSDLFSCAIVLYELMTLTRPFEGESPTTICFRIVSEPHTPMDRLLPRCPLELARILDRALSKRREDRQSSCAEFADELAGLLHLDERRRLELAGEVQKLQNEAILLRASLEDFGLPGFDVTQYLPLARPEGDPNDYGNLIMLQSRLDRQLERAREINQRRTELESKFRGTEQMLQAADWEKAVQLLGELRAVCPGNRRLDEMAEKAKAALENQRREEERRKFVEQTLLQARSSLQREDFQACLAILQAILSSEPDHPDAGGLVEAARKGVA